MSYNYKDTHFVYLTLIFFAYYFIIFRNKLTNDILHANYYKKTIQ